MTVWVVVIPSHDGDAFEGVFSTLEIAKKYAKSLLFNYGAEIREWVVDSAPEVTQ